jgi:hypothetical protein
MKYSTNFGEASSEIMIRFRGFAEPGTWSRDFAGTGSPNFPEAGPQNFSEPGRLPGSQTRYS